MLSSHTDDDVIYLGTFSWSQSRESIDSLRRCSILPHPKRSNPRPSECIATTTNLDEPPSTKRSPGHQALNRASVPANSSNKTSQHRRRDVRHNAGLSAGRQRRLCQLRTAVSPEERERVFKLGWLRDSGRPVFGCLNAGGQMWLGTEDSKGRATSAGVRLRQICHEEVHYGPRFRGFSQDQVEEAVRRILETSFGCIIEDGEV